MFGIMFRGIAVGVTETIPGVSGSTIAMILGIYERLIYSLSILTTNQRKNALPFLFTFGIGMIVGFLFGIFLIDYLLKNYRTPTLMFFIGIIIGFLPYLWKETLSLSENKLKVKHYIIIFLFLCLVIFGQLLGGMGNIDLNNLSLINYLFFAISGMIASTALVLPGISGALVLTIFGIYETAMESLISLNLPVILSIGSGVMLGVLISSRLIRYLLINFKIETYAAMIGLVSGSIYAILSNLEGNINNQTIILSLITFFSGIGFIVILKQTQQSN